MDYYHQSLDIGQLSNVNLQAPHLILKIVAFCTLEAFTVDMPEILFKSTFQNPQVEEIFASIVVKPPIISKDGSKMQKNPKKREKW